MIEQHIKKTTHQKTNSKHSIQDWIEFESFWWHFSRSQTRDPYGTYAPNGTGRFSYMGVEPKIGGFYPQHGWWK